MINTIKTDQNGLPIIGLKECLIATLVEYVYIYNIYIHTYILTI